MNCENCGQPLSGSRSTKRYCSNNCKQSAYMKRNHFSENNPNHQHTLKQNEMESTKTSHYSQTNLTGFTGKNNAQDSKKNAVQWPLHENFLPKPVSQTKIENFHCMEGGTITKHERNTFKFVSQRVMTIMDKLLLFTYSPGLRYFNAAGLLCALETLLDSSEYYQLERKFPFHLDMVNLREQLEQLVPLVDANPEKVTLTIQAPLSERYYVIYNSILKGCGEEVFAELFCIDIKN